MTASAISPVGLSFSHFDDGSAMIAVGTNAVHLTPEQAESLARYVAAIRPTRWRNLIRQLRQAANPDCWTAANAIEMLESRVADKDEIITLLRAQVSVFTKLGAKP
jgi:hypothetical protein